MMVAMQGRMWSTPHTYITYTHKNHYRKGSLKKLVVFSGAQHRDELIGGKPLVIR
jgi:hypothetical protein